MQTALLIDPDTSVRDELHAILDVEYQVHSVGSLDKAVVRVRLASPDIILTELIDRPVEYLYRLQRIWPHVPIIVVTDHSEVRVAVDAMKLGVADYLTKPISPARLWAGIAHAQRQERESLPMEPQSGPTSDSTSRRLSVLLDALGELNRRLAPSTSVDEFRHHVERCVGHLVQCDSVWLLLPGDEGFSSADADLNLPANHPWLEQAFRKRATVRVQEPSRRDLEADPSWSSIDRVVLLAPIFDGDAPVGLIALGPGRDRQRYTELKLKTLSTVATFCGPWLTRLTARTDAPAKVETGFPEAMESLPMALLYVDPSGEIRFATAKSCSLLGHAALVGKPAQALGSEFFEMLVRTGNERARAFCQVRHEDGTTIGLDIQPVRTSEGGTWVLASSSESFRAARDRLTGTLAVWTAVSAEVEHHVRNAMVPIQTLIEHHADAEMDETTRHLHALAAQAVERLHEFVKTLEPFARPASLRQQYVDLNIVLAKAIANIKRGMTVTNQLNVQYTEPLPPLIADRQRLQAVFQALIQHCLVHIPQGETLHILTSKRTNGDGTETAIILIAYPHPSDDWGRVRATRWNIELANVAQTVLAHGGVFYTSSSPANVEHHLEFPVEQF